MVRRVAVVAVHGVGKHKAGETQDAMADLLLSLPGRGRWASQRQYAPFGKEEIQVPLQPVQTESGVYVPAKRSRWNRITNLYQEQSAEFADSAKRAATGRPGQIGLDYTDRLLREYQGGADGNVYRTAMLRGTRLSDGTRVDIYEVLWADLAKPNNSVVAFFLSLFQLILHLASLSRLAIDSGAGEGRGWIWATYRTTQRYAVRLLQIFIPILEVLLLIALASCLPEVWSTTRGHLWLPLLIGAAGGIAVGIKVIMAAKREVTEHSSAWAFRALSPVVIGILIPLAAWFVWGMGNGEALTRADVGAAVLFWLVPGLGFMFWVLSRYEDERKGVLATGILLFIISFVFFIASLWGAYSHRSFSLDPPDLVVLATLRTAQVLLGMVRLCWGLMVVAAIFASLLGGIAWRRMKRERPDGPEWGRARAAVRTSRLALALPVVLFFMVTIGIWASFLEATRHLMPQGSSIFTEATVNQNRSPQWLTPFVSAGLLPPATLNERNPKYLRPKKNQEDQPENEYALRVFAWTVGYHLPITLALVSLTVFLLIWWALPSVLTEEFIRRGKPKAPRDTSDQVSMRMGTWMSRGLDATAVITLLLWIAIFLVPALYQVANPIWRLDQSLGPITFAMVSNTLIGFALLAAIAKRGQTVLATILDVDTYLRTSPIYATPRATIFERYVSTLRYVRSYRDDLGTGYDSIVIVAHSLGALISGDLLQYLQSNNGHEDWYSRNPAGAKFTSIPITLMTMGNPVRQLLNRFFPYLYDWIRPIPDNGKESLPSPLTRDAVKISNTTLPDPSELGLARWINAYRSGDYVGRSVWLDEWYHRPEYGPSSSIPHVVASPDGKRYEMCIGAGAHTRYWDDTAPDIAWMLNTLI